MNETSAIAISAKEKRNWFLFLIGYFLFGYMTLNFYNLNRETYFDVSFAFEQSLPFFPSAILGYCLVFVSLALTQVLIKTAHAYQRAVVAFLAVTTVHFLFFYFMPVRMTLRPDLSASSGVMNFLSHLYFLIDQPTNCFPSLHVAYPTAATWAIWKSAPRWRLPFIVMTLIVAVSVVLVKQHYILDAVVGCLSALLICFLTSNTERYWKKFF